jgi:hypothetical protein
MRTRDFIVLCLWLRLGLAFDLETALLNSSPALNLAPSAHYHVKYEAHGGQQTGIEVSDHSPAVSHLFVSRLEHKVHLWGNSHTDDRDILERQEMTCPEGTCMFPPLFLPQCPRLAIQNPT